MASCALVHAEASTGCEWMLGDGGREGEKSKLEMYEMHPPTWCQSAHLTRWNESREASPGDRRASPNIT